MSRIISFLEYLRSIPGNLGGRTDYTTMSPFERRQLWFELLWSFYNGSHWVYFSTADEPTKTLNYCKKFVDKGVAFLMSRNGFSITHETPEVEKKLEDFWARNASKLFCLDLAQMGGVTGDSFVKVYLDSKRQVQLDLLETKVVDPLFEKYDKTKAEGYDLIYLYTDENDVKHTLIEKHRKDSIWREEDGNVISGTKIDNLLGRLQIVHVKNLPRAKKFWSVSDVEEIFQLNQEYNDVMTLLSEVIHYNGAPVVVIKGAKGKQLMRKANETWSGLPINSDVFFLELSSAAVSAMTEYMERIKTAMHELGSVPEKSLGEPQAISNTSGIAMEMSYLPLIERTYVKRLSYGQGIIDLNELIIDFWKITGVVPKDTPTMTEIAFSSPLPRDRERELNEMMKEKDLGIGSRQEFAERLGKKHVDTIMKQVDDDRQSEIALESGMNARFEEE